MAFRSWKKVWLAPCFQPQRKAFFNPMRAPQREKFVGSGLGGRSVPALAPGASNFFQSDLPIPTQFQASGTYYLIACANGNRAVAETNYANNCQYRQLVGLFHQTPLPPPVCSVSTSIGANFNGTAISAGSYIWFNANFKANGIPSTGATVTFTNSTILLNGTTLNVPPATITFSPTATCATTTYENGMFMTTVPVNGSDEIFLTGLAYPVPASITGGQTTPVWTGTFNSSVHGVSMNWAWGAAVYTNFSTNYNVLAPLAAHGNACVGNSGGDHAGTPEGSISGTPFKTYVIGGATGGGGSNWTGSWSGTQSAQCQ
jgi:hypothetical protein